MLYKYRIKNKKDYYDTTFTKIKKAFQKCLDSIKCVENQEGGLRVMYYENKLNNIYNLLTISSID